MGDGEFFSIMGIMFFSIFIPFATVFGIVYLIVSARHKERMTMLDKGIDLSLLKTEKRKPQYGRIFSNIILKIALLFIGVGIGILLANWLVYNINMEGPVAYPAMIFICSGLGLIASLLIDKKLIKKEDKTEIISERKELVK